MIELIFSASLKNFPFFIVLLIGLPDLRMLSPISWKNLVDLILSKFNFFNSIVFLGRKVV